MQVALKRQTLLFPEGDSRSLLCGYLPFGVCTAYKYVKGINSKGGGSFRMV